ncbi:tetratricopeptide repeat protein [Actinoplanes sp. ATCC 53533]|uniref:ATP-binding protein n=1 Tax=Actinoplanes sp. ATCC 53533 TaxID=1288362 RepID=UPI00131580BC|nr:tetratricopeptide repeat protein [Actinoplanes sp. ATCC 53533]
MATEWDGSDQPSLTHAASVADLALRLRWLRRRQAHQRGAAPLTYRELAARTGWSHGIIGAYLTGKVLPPTDRLDILVRLLGATAAEQGALATARDGVEELLRAGAAPARVVPRQLPGGVAGFTGREAVLDRLDELLDAATEGAVIAAVSGTAGAGKTAVAVHWARRVAERFPDGQLYVNLRGFAAAGSAMTPAEAIRMFLDALGVPPLGIPAGQDAQVGLYRSLLADRQMLVLLDNAATADQIRPLLPAAPGCLALVTSRDQLTSLVANEGAHPIRLDRLSPAEARQLLATRLGAARVEAEPAGVEDIIAACARLPLALVVVAARGAVHPSFPLTALAGELRENDGGLRVWHGGDAAADVRAVFSWSYLRLGPQAARMFRLLGLHPGPDIGEAAAASLAGVPAAEARQALAELVRASLLDEHVPTRYAFHDLLRVYAAELAHTVDSAAERDDAIDRSLDHYLQTGHRAAILLNPHCYPPVIAPVRPAVTPKRLIDGAEARAWFDAEHRVLVAAVDFAGSTGRDVHSWQIAWSLVDYLDRRGHWLDWVAVLTTALAAARRAADLPGQALTCRHLGRAYVRLHRFDEADAPTRVALEIYEQLGDDSGQANIHGNLGYLAEQQSRHRDAIKPAERSLELFRIAGDPRGEGIALNNLGWYHLQLDDCLLALDYCQQALALQRQVDDRASMAITLDSIGYARYRLGQFGPAKDAYQEALRLSREVGDRYYEADTLVHIGDTQHAAGEPEAARRTWHQALSIFDELGHPDAAQLRERLDHLGA